MPTDQMTKARIAALERERAGYEIRLARAEEDEDTEGAKVLKGRISAVDKSLAALKPKPKAKNPKKSTKES